MISNGCVKIVGMKIDIVDITNGLNLNHKSLLKKVDS